jgi:hypothetical protein
MTHWKYTVDVSDSFHNDALFFEEKRDAIVKTLRQSEWVADMHNMVLDEIIDSLEESSTTTEFDDFWNQLYDEADFDRAWIQTHRRNQ